MVLIPNNMDQIEPERTNVSYERLQHRMYNLVIIHFSGFLSMFWALRKICNVVRRG